MSTFSAIPHVNSTHSIQYADTKSKTVIQSDWRWYVLFLWANENSSVGHGLEHF